MSTILRVPPEDLWPTGQMPVELRGNGQRMPVQSADPGIERYVPPPRPQINRDELELERQQLRIVESVSAPAFDPQGSRPVANVQRYLVPLSSSVSAEIVIHGRANPRDYKLLQKYVRLMSSIEPVVAEMSTPIASTHAKKPRIHGTSA